MALHAKATQFLLEADWAWFGKLGCGVAFSFPTTSSKCCWLETKKMLKLAVLTLFSHQSEGTKTAMCDVCIMAARLMSSDGKWNPILYTPWRATRQIYEEHAIVCGTFFMSKHVSMIIAEKYEKLKRREDNENVEKKKASTTKDRASLDKKKMRFRFKTFKKFPHFTF